MYTQYFCDSTVICVTHYTTYKPMQQHMNSKHPGIMLFDLREEMQTSGEELINHGLDCEQCGFKDKLDTNMKSHMIHPFKL